MAILMGYDEELAARIRELISTERGFTEKKMFGGLAFLIGGNMAIAASGQVACWCVVTPLIQTSLSRTMAPASR